MWVFTRESFVSIVQHVNDPALLLVRARQKADIERLWPDAEITQDPSADYRYRAVVARELVAQTVANQIRAITYTTNFKGGVKNKRRHDAYLRVWSAMLDIQN
jgi:hypothetical protein